MLPLCAKLPQSGLNVETIEGLYYVAKYNINKYYKIAWFHNHEEDLIT